MDSGRFGCRLEAPLLPASPDLPDFRLRRLHPFECVLESGLGGVGQLVLVEAGREGLLLSGVHSECVGHPIVVVPAFSATEGDHVIKHGIATVMRSHERGEQTLDDVVSARQYVKKGNEAHPYLMVKFEGSEHTGWPRRFIRFWVGWWTTDLVD